MKKMGIKEMNEEKQQEKFEKVYADDQVLTMESATEFLKSLGWTVEIEGQGYHLATLFLPNREVQFLYHDEQVEDFSLFDCGLLIMSGLFAAACQTINPYNSQTLPVVHLSFIARGLQIFEEKVTVARLKQALDETLEWTMEDRRLQEMFRSQYSLPPWEKDTVDWSTDEINGAPYALLHLAALALLGDVETLQSYQRRFAAGNRLGFDLGSEDATLDESHLERAVLMAEEFAKTEELSYAVLERVAEKLSMKVNHYRRLRVRDPNLCYKKKFFIEKALRKKNSN